ncbi:hypothetical protein ACIA8K_12795 [Catenuloplanes sp. NPDC051500]|uniref:hypothetical protein n=1 Tax=Catenuloplanes sp. NPDC051500 TaxID=3363959 RepID=UPI0037AEE6A6
MALIPRAEEIDLVLTVLESDEYPDGKGMAKALIKQVADILSYRDSVALVHKFGPAGQPGTGINWGPFASNIDASRAAEKIALGGTFHLVKLYAPGALLANATSSKRKGWCQTDGCGHADWMHLQVRSGRGRCIESCPCDEFKK